MPPTVVRHGYSPRASNSETISFNRRMPRLRAAYTAPMVLLSDWATSVTGTLSTVVSQNAFQVASSNSSRIDTHAATEVRGAAVVSLSVLSQALHGTNEAAKRDYSKHPDADRYINMIHDAFLERMDDSSYTVRLNVVTYVTYSVKRADLPLRHRRSVDPLTETLVAELADQTKPIRDRLARGVKIPSSTWQRLAAENSKPLDVLTEKPMYSYTRALVRALAMQEDGGRAAVPILREIQPTLKLRSNRLSLETEVKLAIEAIQQTNLSAVDEILKLR